MTRSRSLLRPTLALCATVIALGSWTQKARAEGREPLHVERLVPARSLAFLSAEDVGSWSKRWNETALARMFADPEMKAFAGPLEEDLRKMLEEKAKGDTPVPPVVMKALEQLKGLSGQVGVALVDVKGGKDAPGGPVIAAGLDFGPHLQDFLTFLQRLKDEMGQDVPIAKTEKDGQSWWTVGSPEKPDMLATTLGTSMLVSTDKAWLDAVLKSGGAATSESLGATDGFDRTRAAAGGAGLALFAYVNVPRVLDVVGEKMGPDARRSADALGLDTVKSAGYGMSFQGDGILDSVVVSAPGADHGLLPMMKMRPMTGKGLAIAPASAFWYEEGTFPYSTMLGKLRDVLGRVEPDMVTELTKFLDGAKEATGIDLETELLPQLTDDTAAYLSIPETGGLYPELAISTAVKDPAKFEATAAKAVDGLLAKLGQKEHVTGSQRVIEWHGHRLHVIDLAGVKKHDMVPFTPTWTMLGDRWIVTLVPHAMKELLLRVEEKAGSLGAQEDVQALLKAAPEGSGAFAYVDLQAVLNLVYDTGVPVLQTIGKPNLIPAPVRLDWAQLPAARSMRPYFRSLGAFVRCDGESLRISVHSPIGAVAPMAVAGLMAATMMGKRHAGCDPGRERARAPRPGDPGHARRPRGAEPRRGPDGVPRRQQVAAGDARGARHGHQPGDGQGVARTRPAGPVGPRVPARGP